MNKKEYPKIMSLLDNYVTEPSKFRTKNRNEIIYEARGTHNNKS